MKAVVDTNVVAYFLLGTAGFVDEVKACFRAVSNPIAPAHWEAELTNVLLRETTSIGVRRIGASRTERPRRIATVSTPFGDVRVKISDPLTSNVLS